MKQQKPFKKIYVEVTNVCNLRCSFCPKTQRTPAYLSVGQFAYILKAIKPYTDYIYLHVLGEPLLHPQLEELLALAHAEGMQVQLTTNGTLLKQKAAVLLKNNRLRQINISLHSFEANTGAKTLENYLDEVLDFVKAVQQTTSTICSLRLWNETSETFLETENKLNQQVLELIAKRFAITDNIAARLREKGSYQIAKGIYINSDKRFRWPDKNTEKIQEKVFCYGLRDHFGILVDGTVIPCCLDGEGTINLGNIYEVPLSEILTSSKAKGIYEGFSNRVATEELCKKCEYATRY